MLSLPFEGVPAEKPNKARQTIQPVAEVFP